MVTCSKALFIFTTAVLCLSEVRSETKTKENTNSGEQHERGILDFFRPPQSQASGFAQPPQFTPELEPMAPTIPIPGNNQGSNYQRPSLLGGLLGTPAQLGGLLDLDKNKAPCIGLNQDWLKYAFQKCAKIDPRLLTAILPTRTNNLREAKMYYFENSTSDKKTWFDAQEWCTAHGMALATTNDVSENKILQEKIKQLDGGSTPAAVANTDNPAAYWIGLHDISKDKKIKWIGDGSSTFVDWHTLTDPVEPDPADGYCGAYSVVGTTENVHMEARDCLTDPTLPKLRFICEVSSECAALFMSRYKYRPHHEHSSEDTGFINFV